jgi:cysteine-rich repeat protein
MTNSTVSGNRTGNGGDGGSSFGGGDAGAGGGIFLSLGNVSLNNVTVAENGTGSGGPGTTPGDGGVGGGITVASGTLNLKNTLVADNEAAVGGPDCFGTLTTQGFNLIGDGSGCSGPVNGVSNDQVGSSVSLIDPLLGTLEDNGGGLATQALLADSPAVNAGDNTTCAATDERGVTRPQGGTCDIGAYEKGTCGDGFPEPEESCDDGNTADGDGCNTACETEGSTTGSTTGGTAGTAGTGGGSGGSTTGGNENGGGCALVR